MANKLEALTEFFNAPLDDIAEIFHYNEENKVILRGDESTFYAKYPRTVSYLNSTLAQKRRDKRTPFEFARDLIINWLLEDYIAFKLSTIGYRTNYNSHDRNRQIISDKVTADPDLKMLIEGRWVPIEVQADYSSWVSNGGSLSIKEWKYNTIVKQNAMLMQVDVPKKSFCLIPTNQLLNPSRTGINHGMGDKPVYIFDNLNLVFSPFDTKMENAPLHTYIPTAITAEKVTERLTPTEVKKYKKRDVVTVSTTFVKSSLF
jgi:hypothetical protein